MPWVPTTTPSTTVTAPQDHLAGSHSPQPFQFQRSTLRARSRAQPRVHGVEKGILSSSGTPPPATLASATRSSIDGQRSSRRGVRTTTAAGGHRSARSARESAIAPNGDAYRRRQAKEIRLAGEAGRLVVVLARGQGAG